ncbi:MAG: SPOR domain-containing protein [Pseudorhodoferax sp.]
MARNAALLLLVANGAYFAWSQGYLAPVGLGPDTGREPQRLEQQIRPEALRVAPAGSVAAAPPAPAACWQAGPFDAARAEALRAALQAAGVPATAWTMEAAGPPARWIVYLGRYADAEALEKQRAELRALRVDTAPVAQPALAPGLSLGVFSTQAAAQQHLAQLGERGVRTARVVAEPRADGPVLLRLPAADAALRERVQALAARPLNPC